MKFSQDEILQIARAVFDREIDALQSTRDILDDGFVNAVMLIAGSRGKIITMGVGKSGMIARKTAATLSSTGAPAVFVHPVECLHGDMGIIHPDDIAIVLSKSGESDEIRKLLLFLKNRGIRVIAVTERPQSHLGRNARCTIGMSVPHEACPMELAPMATSSVQMAIGDALAAVLIRMHDFKPSDFALFHPAGTLGKKLLLKVQDVMHSGTEIPAVTIGTIMRDVLPVMTEKAMGAVLIVDGDNLLEGIFTDGDLRRALQKYRDLMDMMVDGLMTAGPICAHPDDMAIDALHLMEKRPSQISVLPVVDQAGHAVGIVRLHDLILAGL